MLKMIRLFKFLFILPMLVACNSNGEQANETVTEKSNITALKKGVITAHDTSMARMNHIAKLQKKLMQEMTAEDSITFMEAYDELQSARDGMMDWMREFDVPSDSSEVAQSKYLNSEMDKIKAVDKAMLGSISKAEKLLEEKAGA